MKTYHAPKMELQVTDPQDIVCGSKGISIGNGGNDIGNWEWNLPGVAVIHTTDVGKN